MLIDTHAHLAFPDYESDLDRVIANAASEGVTGIICVSASLKEAHQATQIAERYPNVWASVGLHPQNVRPDEAEGKDLKTQIKELENLLSQPKVVAIGETGLDFSPPPPGEGQRSVEEQTILFKKQLELALKYNLPVIIHSRKAKEETLAILDEYPTHSLKGVAHCFSEDWTFAQEILKRGLQISFTGIITFPKATEVQQVAARLPLDKIMVETDCPFLAPQPVRGQRNEPKYVKMIAEKIAELQGKSFEEIALATTANAQSLFCLKDGI